MEHTQHSKPMRIALISKADHSGGGASKVAEDLRQTLLADGHEVVHWVSWSKTGYHSRLRRLYGEQFQRKFYRWTRAVKSWFAPDLIPFELPNLFWQNLPANFDLVHIHDISFAASPYSLRYLARRMPTLWTLHDCSALTGGCIQPMECNKFKLGCGDCPQHGSPPLDSRFDYSALKWRVNRKTLMEPNLQTAAPSRWLLQLTEATASLSKPALLLPNAVDTNIFHPQTTSEKFAIRQQLNLIADQPTILLGAAQLNNPYKGILLGLAALRILKQQGLTFNVLLVGESSAEISAQFADLLPIFTGFIDNPERINDIYAASDLLLCPSIADNQPLQVLEALAADLPVIAFSTGGIPEILKPICPQWIANHADVQDLADRIKLQLSQPAIPAVRPRAHIERHYSLTRFLQQHLAAYEQTIQQWQTTKR